MHYKKTLNFFFFLRRSYMTLPSILIQSRSLVIVFIGVIGVPTVYTRVTNSPAKISLHSYRRTKHSMVSTSIIQLTMSR